MSSPGKAEQLKALVERALHDMKAVDVVSAKVQGQMPFTDYMVIASGRSSRHVRALADGLMEAAKLAGHGITGVEGYEYNTWVLVDLDDVVVHLMQAETRDYYQLEKLWLDAAESEAQ